MQNNLTITCSLSTGSFFSISLFLLFLGLKLGHIITWSWWWVFAPLWIPPLLIFGIIGIIAIGYGVLHLISKW